MYNLKKEIFFVLAIQVIIFFLGCSNKTMSFFFDGIPNHSDSLNIVRLDSLKRNDSVQMTEIMAKAIGPQYIIHPPYQQKECTACHDPNMMGKFVEPQPALCYQCHDNFASTYKFLHAPVEGGECTSCHNPHMTENEKLLLRKGQLLCFFCHDKEDILKQENHDGIDDTNCTECHNPHGSNEEHLLN